MKEKKLLLIALIGSLFGIFALYIISDFTDYEKRSIDEIDELDQVGMVKMTGKVVSSHFTGNHTFIKIVQPDYLDIVVFNSDARVGAGEYIEIIGESAEYDGDKEIIAHRIRII